MGIITELLALLSDHLSLVYVGNLKPSVLLSDMMPIFHHYYNTHHLWTGDIGPLSLSSTLSRWKVPHSS